MPGPLSLRGPAARRCACIATFHDLSAVLGRVTRPIVGYWVRFVNLRTTPDAILHLVQANEAASGLRPSS